MISINELQEKWNNISPYKGGFLLVSGEHPLSFHIGYLNGENKCFVVLNTGEVKNIDSSRAISVDCIQMEKGDYGLRFTLNYPSLDELFVKLCWDLIYSSKEAINPIERIILQYKRWMKLLQKAHNSLLSSSSQKGLIGELFYLAETIERIGEEAAMSSWVGPEGSDQDFIFEKSWAEIKTTTIASTTVTISSIQQLDREDNGHLVVYFMDKITANGQNTVSLPEIVAKVHRMLSDGMRDEFLCKLAKYGYFDKDEDSYKNNRYRHTNKKVFLVEKEFPRLVRHNLPTEVVNARYDLSLSAIERFEI